MNNIAYPSQFPGSDWCAKVAAAITFLPAAGGVVDARGFSTAQTCAANPFSGVTKPVHLLWGNYTVTTNVQWVLATSDIVIEGIHGQATTSFLQAGASFPTSTAVVAMGDNTAIYFGQRIEYLRIHCNQLAGSIGILMRGLNEQSGTDHDAISECIGNAIKIDGSTQSTANFSIHDTNINNTTAATGDSVALGTVAGNITLDRMSITSVVAQSNAAIHVTSSGSGTNFIRDIHLENYTDGISADGSNLYVSGVSCNTSTVNCLHVPSPGTGNATTLVAQAILNNANNAANPVIKNDVTGTNISSANPPAAGGTVPWYSWSRTAANEAWMDNLGLHSRNLNLSNLLMSITAPTITGHFNTSGDSISNNNGTASFTVTVGTGVAGNTGTVGLPTASHGWACIAQNQNRGAFIQQTSNTTASATFTNYGTTIGTPVNWTNSDVLAVNCNAF